MCILTCALKLELAEKTRQLASMREPEITRNPIHRVNRVDNGSDILRHLKALEMNQGSHQTMSCNSEPRTYPCTICSDESNIGPHCPLFYPCETTRDQVSVLYGGMNSKYEGRPKFDPYSNTYNPGWKHNPNFSWSKGNHQGGPSSNPPPGISKNQVQVQEPSPVDKKVSFLEEKENGTFPSQKTPNPKGVNQVNRSCSSNHNEHSKAVMTLRSGKTLENSVELPKDSSPSEKETKVDQTSSKDPNGTESAKIPSEEDIPERVYVPPAPFPRRLAKKKPSTYAEILDIFKQVKINLPLLDAIKHVPDMEKFLKDMCTVKRDESVHKRHFDPTSSQKIENAILDLGDSVNLLPFSVYEQLRLGEMKPTRITLQLADRSVKIPRGILEAFLVQVANFIYPVDFVILDTQPVTSQDINIPIILGYPFLSTANAVMHCQISLVEFSFGNQKISVNVFKALQATSDPEHYESICMIDSN
ncbi:uncharacterized protein LOC113305965 [Papaver somniferum]|uniref:uncharacterized protein LOC113305965 n=1 Tax=Papaver somniferum TaxID=3469 RepID=UPI000E6FB581|nr:uncharacterized protein LOC113305965 [Papaver somniferum]